MNNIELEKEVKKLIHSTAYHKGIISVVDILQQLGYLSAKDYEDWRFGRVDYLEKVCKTNLTKLNRIHQFIRKYAGELSLKPSYSVYKKYGKGAKTQLRFSKSGAKAVEEKYATHYVDVKRIDVLKERKNLPTTDEPK